MLYLLYCLLGASHAICANQPSLAELDSILLNRNISQADKEKYVAPMLAIIKSIESKEIIDIDFKLAPICRKIERKQECRDSYIPFNPSIMKTPEGYAVICRTNTHYLGTEKIPGVTIGTKNYFLKYDKNFKLTYEQEIPALRNNHAKNISKYHQIEDCRLFNWNGESWVAGTVLVPRKDVGGHLTRIGLSQLNCFDNKEPVCFQNLTILDGPEESRQEKNWMPIVLNENLQFIYLYDPFIILEPCTKNGVCKEVLRYTPTLDFSRFRGSAAPIEFEDGYLMMTHERFGVWDYTHRFLFLDKSFKITKISLPFKFEDVNVEFCTSMVFDHSNKNLAIAVGIYDSRAKIFNVDIKYLKELLFAIPT